MTECPKCGSKEIEKGKKVILPVVLMGNGLAKRYCCKKCGYIELYKE